MDIINMAKKRAEAKGLSEGKEISIFWSNSGIGGEKQTKINRKFKVIKLYNNWFLAERIGAGWKECFSYVEVANGKIKLN